MPNMKSPLTGCTTIDSTTPDGYLDNARAGNPMAGANGTTKQAASNLLTCEKAKVTKGLANLVGHGCEGDIDTGKAAGQCIRYDNKDEWEDDMATLVSWVEELFLFGCTVGAGEEGAQLLFELAKVIDAPVSAPTGLIYCNSRGDFRLEDGAVWQRATPNVRPAPIDPPHATQSNSSMDQASFVIAGRRQPVEIKSATYTPYGHAPMSEERSMKLAAEVAWDQPFTTEDEPGAKVTGHLEVTGVAGDTTFRKSFHVLAHSVLRDGHTYYRVTSGFRKALGLK